MCICIHNIYIYIYIHIQISVQPLNVSACSMAMYGYGFLWDLQEPTGAVTEPHPAAPARPSAPLIWTKMAVSPARNWCEAGCCRMLEDAGWSFPEVWEFDII